MQRFIELIRVSFAYHHAPILHEVSIRFDPGWSGVVGANGSGKSTLAALLTGDLVPDAGTVRRAPADLAVAFVAQSVERRTPAVTAFAARQDGAAAAWRGMLALSPDDLGRWPSLSPGERKRWQIAAALAAEPDALVLDEPDAHLDVPGRRLVLGALERFRGIGVLVSHRRDVLEMLTRRTIFVEDGKLFDHASSFSEARASRDRDRRAREDERRALRTQRDQVEASLGALRERQRRAERQKSAGARMKSPRDSDARGFAGTFAASKASAAFSRRINAAASRRDRVDEAIAGAPIRRELGADLVLRAGEPPGGRVVAFVTDEVAVGGKRLLGPTSLTLEATSRVRLAGPNGSGKSTLLALIARAAGARAFYLPQTASEEDRRRAREDVVALAPTDRGRALALVAALGTEPERLLDTKLPSPGEAKKLLLARALVTEPCALLLDEPTNDLDLPTTERLERALIRYPGALVLVTHDETLAKATTSEVWSIQGGTVRLT